MFHVYGLTAPHTSTPHTIAIFPGPLPVTARPNDAVHVFHTFDTLDAANAYQRQLEAHWQQSLETVILCEQTNETFVSGYAAAKAVGASQSAMSNHLRGASGYRTVKGFTFRRLPASIAAQMASAIAPRSERNC